MRQISFSSKEGVFFLSTDAWWLRCSLCCQPTAMHKKARASGGVLSSKGRQGSCEHRQEKVRSRACMGRGPILFILLKNEQKEPKEDSMTAGEGSSVQKPGKSQKESGGIALSERCCLKTHEGLCSHSQYPHKKPRVVMCAPLLQY